MIGNLIATKGFGVEFLHGSALSKINTYNPETFNSDIKSVSDLYINEANIFLDEMRNVVSPLIKRIHGLIEDTFKEKSIAVPSSYKVNILNTIPYFEELENNGLLNRIGTGVLPKNLVLGFPITEECDMKEKFITGDEDLDSMALKYVNELTDGELRAWWNKYMLDFSGENTLLLELEYLHFRNIKTVIMMYAAVKNILAGKVSYVLNKNVFDNNHDTIRDFVNTVVSKFNSFISKHIKLNLIINSFFDNSTSSYSIYISEDLYNAYLESGEYGMDSVIGYVLESHKNNTLKSCTLEFLLENEKLYKDVYANTYRLESMVVARKNIEMRKTVLRNSVLTIMSLAKSATEKNRVVKFDLETENTILKYVDSLEDKDLDNTMAIIVKIISIMSDDAGHFMTTMEGQSRFLSNVSDSSKEAALYAVIERLITKLMKDVKLIKVN